MCHTQIGRGVAMRNKIHVVLLYSGEKVKCDELLVEGIAYYDGEGLRKFYTLIVNCF